ncbi:hypothetical protein AB0D15_37920, partial [Streptomyces sp. NPDC048551]
MTTSDIAGAAPVPSVGAAVTGGSIGGAAIGGAAGEERPGRGDGDPRAPHTGGEAGPRARGRGALPAAAPQAVRRRSGGDPVKALLHRHRELCERAVDPLEIAAGLEAHGISDRTATRFRHRDATGRNCLFRRRIATAARS